MLAKDHTGNNFQLGIANLHHNLHPCRKIIITASNFISLAA